MIFTSCYCYWCSGFNFSHGKYLWGFWAWHWVELNLIVFFHQYISHWPPCRVYCFSLDYPTTCKWADCLQYDICGIIINNNPNNWLSTLSIECRSRDIMLHLYKKLAIPHLEYCAHLGCPAVWRMSLSCEGCRKKITRMLQGLEGLSYRDAE